MNLSDMKGRVVVVLTPELRQLGINQIMDTLSEGDPERDDLIAWFQAQETPNGYVLDAANSEGECVMIEVILRAVLDMYQPDPADGVPAPDDLDTRVRTLSR